jgi:hypothetical protein
MSIMMVDVTDTVSAELHAEILRRGARLFQLELGTLMVRHLETLDTAFYADVEDAAGQLLHGKPPKRRQP